MEESLLFLVGLVVVACCVLAGLYVLVRYTRRGRRRPARRKPSLADVE